MAPKATKAAKPKSAIPLSERIGKAPVDTPAANGIHEKIRHLAYSKWEGAGRPLDDGVRFWLEAEQECTRAGAAS